MGVMNCSRNNCDNILCNTYVNDIGYICDSCKEEFSLYLKYKNWSGMFAHELMDELKKFIDINKDGKIDIENNVDEFFEIYGR